LNCEFRKRRHRTALQVSVASDDNSEIAPADEPIRHFKEWFAEAQREQFATLTLNTAVELTAAALQQVSVEGGADEQSIALRDAMRVLFPEAVALVSAARQGFMREG